ncbi:VOC family protein [Sulfitobacter sp.]|uniref:VOC family protein n=1 Tax=Sulfitobacter sp. TaxID=1903071 RepID=UPI00300381CC
MTARLEHANYTVSDCAATAAWMSSLFGWHIRWQGDSIHEGKSVHVGTKDQYLALYQPATNVRAQPDTYTCLAGLNHIAVVVHDLDATERAVRAHGFEPHSHQDYEPGRRFYFNDYDGIEYEVVQYN